VLLKYFCPKAAMTNGCASADHRIVGMDTQRNAIDGVPDMDFVTKAKESFNQEYQAFNLLVRFSEASTPAVAPVVTINSTSIAGALLGRIPAAGMASKLCQCIWVHMGYHIAMGLANRQFADLASHRLPSACLSIWFDNPGCLGAGGATAAAVEAAWGSFRTDPFNAHQQYAAVDIDVTAIAGSDLAARLPASWLPLAKNTPQFESAMRQRGYLVSRWKKPYKPAPCLLLTGTTSVGPCPGFVQASGRPCCWSLNQIGAS